MPRLVLVCCLLLSALSPLAAQDAPVVQSVSVTVRKGEGDAAQLARERALWNAVADVARARSRRPSAGLIARHLLDEAQRFAKLEQTTRDEQTEEGRTFAASYRVDRAAFTAAWDAVEQRLARRPLPTVALVVEHFRRSSGRVRSSEAADTMGAALLRQGVKLYDDPARAEVVIKVQLAQVRATEGGERVHHWSGKAAVERRSDGRELARRSLHWSARLAGDAKVDGRLQSTGLRGGGMRLALAIGATLLAQGDVAEAGVRKGLGTTVSVSGVTRAEADALATTLAAKDEVAGARVASYDEGARRATLDVTTGLPAMKLASALSRAGYRVTGVDSGRVDVVKR